MNIEEGKTPEQKAVLYPAALAGDRQAEAERIFLSVALGKDFDKFCKALDEFAEAETSSV